MSNLIPWYVVELRSRLLLHLPTTQVETITTEAESHLKELARDLAATMQMDEERAAAAAIDAFGRPDKVAMSHLAEFAWHPLGVRPIWMVAGSAGVSTMIWVMQWQWLRGFFDTFGESWLNGLAGMIGVFALFVFGIGCYAGRRRYVREILAIASGLCVGIVLVFSFLIVGDDGYQQGFNRLHLARDVETAQKNIGALDRIEAYVLDGHSVFAKAKRPADIPARFTDPDAAEAATGLENFDRMLREPMIRTSYGFVRTPSHPVYAVPSNFAMALVDGRVSAPSSVEDFDHAQLWWRRHTSDELSAIAQQREAMRGLLASAGQARSGRLFFFNPHVYWPAVLLVLPWVPLLLLIDAMAYGLVRRRRTYPGLVRA